MESVWYLVPSFVLITLCSQCCGEGGENYGVAYGEDVSNPKNNGHFCMMYNPLFKKVPLLLKDAPIHNIQNLLPSMMCDEPMPPPALAGDIGALSRGNCTFSEKARLIQQYKGSAALIVSSRGLVEPTANQTSDYEEINITVALMAKSDFDEMMGLGKSVRIQLYSPGAPTLDYNLIVIWLLAVGTLTAGAMWSGHVRHKQWLKKYKKRKSGSAANEPPESEDEEQEEESFEMNPKIVVIFVVMMCVMLLTLYFLYDYLVYLIIGLFTFASSMAMYFFLKPAYLRIRCIGNCRIPANNLPLLKKQPEIRRICLALFCIGLSVWWLVERNKHYAWILQNILGVAFCIHMMKTLRLPNLKACTILLVLLFFYDIFFVFITPLFTKSGESVMVDVATGGSSSSGEMLPMVLKVPRFTNSALSVCSLPFSLLGYGDILIPGLLVSYCHGFDLKVKSGSAYLIANVIAYGVGLVICFVGMALMSTGQPALLYLVPCTLLTTVMVAAKRKELRHIWQGELVKKSDDRPSMNGECSPHVEREPPTIVDLPPGGLSVQAPDNHDGSSQTSTDNEQQQLLHSH